MEQSMKRLYDAALVTKGLSAPAQIARELGVSPQVISNWESRGISSSGLVKAQKVFGCSSVWLSTGLGEMLVSSAQNASDVVETALSGRVPLVSWVMAGGFSEAIDSHQPGHAENWVDTTVKVNRHTFALKVFNDSMEPDFPPGVILIVEPDLDPLPGDYVIAKNGDNEATFKQLIKDGPDFYLKPLNPRYPIIKMDKSCRIVGVVRSAERRLR